MRGADVDVTCSLHICGSQTCWVPKSLTNLISQPGEHMLLCTHAHTYMHANGTDIYMDCSSNGSHSIHTEPAKSNIIREGKRTAAFNGERVSVIIPR